MLFQPNPGMYVYRKSDLTGNIKLIYKYETIESFFKSHIRADFEEYSHNFDDRWRGHIHDSLSSLEAEPFQKSSHFCYVVFDENGNCFSPFKLTSLRNEWVNHFVPRWRRRRACFGSRRVYGRFRHINTTQERRKSVDIIHEISEDGDIIKVLPRPRRNVRNLPSAWDDIWGHNEKCWKTQSKRKHQWK